MFRPSDILIDEFVKHLDQDYTASFGDGVASHRDAIRQVAQMALLRIARSDALYHDLGYAFLITLVGQEILIGRMTRDGDVTSNDWVHFVASLLCATIGFGRDSCPGDADHTCVIDETGGTIALPRGATDGYLWPYFADRSKIFVGHFFRDHSVLDPEILAANIEYSRFPPLPDRNLETGSYPGLLRAALYIGAVADPHFLLKMRRIFLQATESGVADQLGYPTPEEFFTAYTTVFWSILYPLIVDGMELLKYTGEGCGWLANMHAHLLIEQNREHPA